MSRIYNDQQPRRAIANAAMFITGAGSGIGAATARLFAEEGAYVAVTDLNGEKAEAVAADIVDNGGRAQAWQLDVGDGAAITRVIDSAAQVFGGLDCLINNAGYAVPAPIDDVDFEAKWDRAIGVMLSATPRAIRAALPWLQRSPFPRIVSIASTEAVAASARLSPYSAAKAGITGLTRSLAVELGPQGITVNCICPGPIETVITQGLAEDKKFAFANKRTALRRYGLPEEIAQMVLNLCLPGASYVTGATIPVDGGLLIRSN